MAAFNAKEKIVLRRGLKAALREKPQHDVFLHVLADFWGVSLEVMTSKQEEKEVRMSRTSGRRKRRNIRAHNVRQDEVRKAGEPDRGTLSLLEEALPKGMSHVHDVGAARSERRRKYRGDVEVQPQVAGDPTLG